MATISVSLITVVLHIFLIKYKAFKTFLKAELINEYYLSIQNKPIQSQNL